CMVFVLFHRRKSVREVRPLRRIIHILSFLSLILVVGPLAGAAEDDPEKGSLNKPDRLEWFRDQGFGLFIHWSVDSQLGVVISHSLVGASQDFVERYFTELPKTFNPHKFNPQDWAVLARLAGIRYV